MGRRILSAPSIVPPKSQFFRGSQRSDPLCGDRISAGNQHCERDEQDRTACNQHNGKPVSTDGFRGCRVWLIFEIAQRKAGGAFQALHVGGHGTNSPMLDVCSGPQGRRQSIGNHGEYDVNRDRTRSVGGEVPGRHNELVLDTVV